MRTMDKTAKHSVKGQNNSDPSWSPARSAIQAFFDNSNDEYHRLSFPSRKDEAWRSFEIDENKYSFLIDKRAFTKKLHQRGHPLARKANFSGYGQYLRNTYNYQLAQYLLEQGVIFCDLSSAIVDHPDLVNELIGKLIPFTKGKFAGLINGSAENGAFLYIPPNVKIELPLNIELQSPSGGRSEFYHHIIWCDKGSRASIVLDRGNHVNQEITGSFLGEVMEIIVDNNSQMDILTTQSLDTDVDFISYQKVRILEQGYLNFASLSSGSHQTKAFMEFELVGEGAEAKISGLILSEDTQHIDIETRQLHANRSTTSDLNFKSVAWDKGSVVWRGMVRVEADAAKSDGYQKSESLVLSSQARINTIPGLEILNNDVKCSHGAVVRRLSKEELFYLQARGLDQKQSETLLINGFLNQIIDLLRKPMLVQHTEKFIKGKIVEKE